MRLIQRSKDQTGSLIAECCGQVIEVPLFTSNLLSEAGNVCDLRDDIKALNIFVVLSKESQKDIIKKVKKFKAETGSFPRYLMDQLRTGFPNGGTLHQCSDLCYYK